MRITPIIATAVFLTLTNFVIAQKREFDENIVKGYLIREMYSLDSEKHSTPVSYNQAFMENFYLSSIHFEDTGIWFFTVNFARSKDLLAFARVSEEDCKLLFPEEEDLTNLTCYSGIVTTELFKEKGSMFNVEILARPQQTEEEQKEEYARFTYQMDSGSYLQVIGKMFYSNHE